MHRRTYLRTLVAGGTAAAGVGIDALGPGVAQPAQAQSNSEWNQQVKLTADDGDVFDDFGFSVAVSSDGTTAMICARGDDNSNGDGAGSAYVFTSGDGDDGPPPLPGQENPPRDIDGDGLYEDVNGDGEFTIADVQVFFQNRDSDVVQSNAEFFNFQNNAERSSFADNDPPDVTIGDVQALFQLFQERG